MLLFGPDAATAATIVMNEFGDHQVVQRVIGGTSGVVTVAGTYTDAVDHIDAEVVMFAGGSVVMPRQTIAPAVSGNTYSGSLSVPQGGWYKLIVSGRDAAGTQLCADTSTVKWGVGINILCIGQSNMTGEARETPFVAANDLAACYSNDNVWEHLADPYEHGGSTVDVDFNGVPGGSVAPDLANELISRYNIPVGLIPSAKGWSGLAGSDKSWYWGVRTSANHADPTTLYGNSVGHARIVGGVELIVMHQGERDMADAVSAAVYQTRLQQLIGWYREDLYAAIPLFICQIGRFTGTGWSDSAMSKIRSAQAGIDGTNGIVLAATCTDLPMTTGDNFHYATSGYTSLGQRIAAAVARSKGSAVFSRGPFVSSAAFANAARTTIDVGITHRGGSDFTPTTGITGFQVLGNNDTVVIASVVHKNTNTVTITLNAALTGTGTVRYQYGLSPVVTGAVKDNSTLLLPLEPTTADISITPSAPVLVDPVPNASGAPLDMTLRWKRAGGASNYRVQLADNAAFATPLVDVSALVDTTRSVSGLSCGTRYYWRVNATNAAGTGLWSTDSFVTIPSSITVTEFGDHQIIQRTIGAVSGSVTFRGIYNGTTIHHIDATVCGFSNGTTIVSRQTIVPAVSGGVFSSAVTVPQGGWYKVIVSGRDAAGTQLCADTSTVKWGVGINILCIGQSNMVGYGTPTPYTVASDLASCFGNQNAWAHLQDPYDNNHATGDIDRASWEGAGGTQAGSLVPSLANSLIGYLNIPVGFIPCARGGTALHGDKDSICWIYRNSANHADTTTLYGNSITNAVRVGGVEAILMFQGETDADHQYSQTTYDTDLRLLLSRYREDLYATIPLLYCQIGRTTWGDASYDQYFTGVRAVHALLDDGVNFFMGSTAMDQVLKDQWHYTKTAYDTLGMRLAQAFKKRWGAAVPYRGPSVSNAAFTDGTGRVIDVTITHRGGTDFTPASAITGFEVLDNGTPAAITSVTRTSASTITITLSSAPSGACSVRYQYGRNPVISGAVRDNAALRLPLEPTTAPVGILPAAAVLVSPAGNATGVSLTPGLTWKKAGGASTYRVQLADNAAFATPLVDVSALVDTTRSVSGLSCGTRYYWRVNATNAAGTGLWSTDSFTTVLHDLAAIGAKSVSENSPLQFGVSILNLDASNPSLAATGLPAGGTFTDNGNGSGTFSWTPSYSQSGSYQVKFKAVDGAWADSEIVTITVNNVNRVPDLAAIGAKSTNENQLLSVSVTATDPDGGTLTLTTSTLPTGALFTDNGNGTGSFSWTPDFTQAGSYPVTFRVTDGALKDSEVVTITVNNINRAPAIAAVSPTIMPEDSTDTVSLSVSDPDDGDLFTCRLIDVPAGLDLAMAAGAPDIIIRSFGTAPGSYNFKVVAADQAGAADTAEITLTVQARPTGSLFVICQTPGATVFRDAGEMSGGLFIGNAVQVITGIRTGVRTIGIAAPGCRPQVLPVTIHQNKIDTITVMLHSAAHLCLGMPRPVVLPTFKGTPRPAAVDFNGDGILDLAVVDTTGRLVFHPNIGTTDSMSFGAAVQATVNGQWPFSFTPNAAVLPVGLDAGKGDGVIIVNRDGDVWLLSHRSGHDFADTVRLASTGIMCNGAALCDVDVNGTPDLIIAPASGGLMVLPNNGSEGLPSLGSGFAVCGSDGTPLGAPVSAVRAADLDGDGQVEIITVGPDGTISFLEGSCRGAGDLRMNERRFLIDGVTSVNDAGAPFGIAFAGSGSVLICGANGTISQAGIHLSGDYNRDGIIDVEDLQVFGDTWGLIDTDSTWENRFNLSPEPDGAGRQRIDINDLQIFGDNWNKQ